MVKKAVDMKKIPILGGDGSEFLVVENKQKPKTFKRIPRRP
jgi:hypothetical protein